MVILAQLLIAWRITVLSPINKMLTYMNGVCWCWSRRHVYWRNTQLCIIKVSRLVSVNVWSLIINILLISLIKNKGRAIYRAAECIQVGNGCCAMLFIASWSTVKLLYLCFIIFMIVLPSVWYGVFYNLSCLHLCILYTVTSSCGV